MAKPKQNEAEKAYHRKEECINRILAHLRDHGPEDYNRLYVMFDPHQTAPIREVVKDIIACQYAKNNGKRRLELTPLGLSRLKNLGA